MLALPSRTGLWPQNRGIGTDHWKPLGLNALPKVAIASLAFIFETDRRPAHHSTAVSHEPQFVY